MTWASCKQRQVSFCLRTDLDLQCHLSQGVSKRGKRRMLYRRRRKRRTGPSFTRATSIMAWNLPSLTFSSRYSLRTFWTKYWYNRLASSGLAAPWKSGFVPFVVLAKRVNCETRGYSQH